MPEAQIADASNQINFIKEVFIDPIRSVLLVDDEFPTLDALIKANCNGSDFWLKAKPEVKENAQRLNGLLNYSRARGREWIVDIHDGVNIEFEGDAVIAKHLHHSDLLILDYKLQGDHHPNGSERAVKILKNLAKSEHFNLVILYSKEDAEKVFHEIAVELLQPWKNIGDINHVDVLKRELADWESDDDNILQKMKGAIDHDVYLQLLKRGEFDPNNEYVIEHVNDFLHLFEAKPDGVEVNKEEILKALLRDVEVRMGHKGEHHSEFEFLPDDKNWLHCGNLFVTVIKKVNVEQEKSTDEAKGLVDYMLEALEDWSPPPNRLIALKFIEELGKRGFRPDDPAFSQIEMQALWLKKLLENNESIRQVAVKQAIDRYVDNLRIASVGLTQKFAEKLLSSIDVGGGVDGFIKDEMKIDFGNPDKLKLGRIQHNNYVCSQFPEGNHLTTGHIFKMDDDYWVCLTPACDMEPKKFPNKRRKHYLPATPFKAIQLHPVDVDVAIRNSGTGLYVFLDINGESKQFCYAVNQKINTAPLWFEMYAHNQESFHDERKLKISHVKEGEDPGTWEPDFIKKEAVVVSQLRYEYAINLMQQLGSSLSRVGLDFESEP